MNAWIASSPQPVCPAPTPPDPAVFARAVQPALEVLTCTNCHQAGLGGFTLVPTPDAAQLAQNYLEVVRHLDLEFPPISPVLLRVREDCMQARLLAWVGNQPQPDCVVSLANFRGSFPAAPPRR